MIILKWLLKTLDIRGGHGLNMSQDTIQLPASCQDCNEPSGSINGRELHD
jgi:hypothetical protein